MRDFTLLQKLDSAKLSSATKGTINFTLKPRVR